MQRSPVAIVTGASENLGSAVALRLTASGYRVARVERKVMHFAEEYDCEIDLSDPTSVGRAFAEVARRAGKLDAVVHAVDCESSRGSIIETPGRQYLELFEANVMTTLHVLKATLPLMYEQHEGSIAVVCSALAEAPPTSRWTEDQAAYAASKAAQLRLVQAAALEAKPFHVRVNAVLASVAAGLDMDSPERRAAAPNTEDPSWLQPRDVAEVLGFLVSPAAAAVQGQALKL